MFCKRACAGVLVSAVRVMSTPELVGVHAKGGGKRIRDLSGDADRQADDEVEAKRGCWGMGRREVRLLYPRKWPEKFIRIFSFPIKISLPAKLPRRLGDPPIHSRLYIARYGYKP